MPTEEKTREDKTQQIYQRMQHKSVHGHGVNPAHATALPTFPLLLRSTTSVS